MGLLLLSAGLVLTVVVSLDVVTTATATGRSGSQWPISNRFARFAWSLLVASHRRWPSHRRLRRGGMVVALSVVVGWILGLWLGWTLVLASSKGAVLVTATSHPADLGERSYFTGYSLLTLGNGEYRPGTGVWQIVTLAVSGTGLGLVTLAVTYLINLVQAGSDRRVLADSLSCLGSTPDQAAELAWDGSTFGGLDDHFRALLPLISKVREHHVTFPVLHYLHIEDRRRALPVQIAVLAETLDRLADKTPSVRPSSSATTPMHRELLRYLEAMEGRAYAPTAVSGGGDGPDGELAIGRDRILALLQSDGWTWDDVVDP